MDKLDVKPTNIPHAEILNQEQAQNWVEELIEEMMVWRRACDVKIPNNKQIAVKTQQRALWSFLTKQGQVIGALKSLKLCGLISERCYLELNQKAINTLVPTVVGGN